MENEILFTLDYCICEISLPVSEKEGTLTLSTHNHQITKKENSLLDSQSFIALLKWQTGS